MNIGTLLAHIGLDNSKLKSGAKDSERTIKGMSSNIENQLGGSAFRTAGILGGLATAFSAAYLISQVRSGIEAIGDLHLSVVKIASSIATMQGGNTEEIAKNYKQAKIYAEDLVLTLKEIDAQSFANADGLRAMSEVMVQQGVLLDTNNTKQKESFAALSNMIAMYTQGQNQALQTRQEMRALLTGESRMGAIVAQTLDRLIKAEGTYKNGLKDIIEISRESKGGVKFWEMIEPYLAGVKAALPDIANSWEAVTSSMETAKTVLKQEIFADVYKVAVEKGLAFVNWLKNNTKEIASTVKMAADAMLSAAKIATAYFVVYVAAPAIIHLVVVALQRLQIQLALASAEMVGATTSAKLYALVMGKDVVTATWAAAGAMEKLKITGQVLFSFFIGWEIGKWIEKHCAVARKAMVALIAVMDAIITAWLVGWKTLGKTLEAGISLDFKGAITESKKGYETWKAEMSKIKAQGLDTMKAVGARSATEARIKAVLPEMPGSPNAEKAEAVLKLNQKLQNELNNLTLTGIQLAKLEYAENVKNGADEVIARQVMNAKIAALNKKHNESLVGSAKKTANEIKALNKEMYNELNNLTLNGIELAKLEYSERVKFGGDRILAHQIMTKKIDDINEELMKNEFQRINESIAANAERDKNILQDAQALKEAQISLNLSRLDTAEAFHTMDDVIINEKRLENIKQLLKYQEEYGETVKRSLDKKAWLDYQILLEGTRANLLKIRKEFEALHDGPMAGAIEGYNQYLKSIPTLFDSMREAAQKSLESIQSTLSDLFGNILTGKIKSWGDYFNTVSNQILRNIGDIMAKMTMSTMTGKSGGWGDLVTSLFSMASNANGGVYASPSLSQYSGQIVSKPTFFTFANGGGVMGEGADPEGIFPLARDSSGKLGVRAVNGTDESGKVTTEKKVTHVHNWNINAIDAQSFFSYLMENREAVAMAMGSLVGDNSPIRRVR